MINEAINKVVERIDLEEEEMAEVIEQIMEGGATPSQISSFLTALRMKGEAVSEFPPRDSARIARGGGSFVPARPRRFMLLSRPRAAISMAIVPERLMMYARMNDTNGQAKN